MHRKKLVLATILALTLGPSVALGADVQALEHVLEQWAAAWSSNDVEKVLPLFTDNVVYEDVIFGAVNNGKKALRDFATTTFAAFQDLEFELKSRIVASDGNRVLWNGPGEAGKPKTSPDYQQPTRRSKCVV